MVPVDWIGRTALFERWQSCVRHACDVFHYPIQQDCITASFERVTANGHIDFGLLNESFQKKIIQRVLAAKENSSTLQQMNSFLVRPGEVAQTDRLVRENKDAIMSNYDERSYCRRLMRIYKSVSQQPVEQRIDKTVLLSEFLKLSQFSLLKWCGYVE
jgi:hypothetical protein